MHERKVATDHCSPRCSYFCGTYSVHNVSLKVQGCAHHFVWGGREGVHAAAKGRIRGEGCQHPPVAHTPLQRGRSVGRGANMFSRRSPPGVVLTLNSCDRCSEADLPHGFLEVVYRCCWEAVRNLSPAPAGALTVVQSSAVRVNDSKDELQVKFDRQRLVGLSDGPTHAWH